MLIGILAGLWSEEGESGVLMFYFFVYIREVFGSGEFLLAFPFLSELYD